MLLGGYAALRQTDLKLVLAFGTVSQLGFLTMLIGSGTPQLYLAGLCVLAAHSTFKSGLFLTTGTIEKQTGTREFPSLCGLGERSRTLAICALAGILSMSGIPITSGYLGKEHAITALMGSADNRQSAVVLAVLIVGSALTFAYSLRYFWGAFSHKHDREGACPHLTCLSDCRYLSGRFCPVLEARPPSASAAAVSVLAAMERPGPVFADDPFLGARRCLDYGEGANRFSSC